MPELLSNFAGVLRAYSGVIYTLLAVALVLLWLVLTITTGPAGTVVTGPVALLALVLRKLDQIHKNR